FAPRTKSESSSASSARLRAGSSAASASVCGLRARSRTRTTATSRCAASSASARRSRSIYRGSLHDDRGPAPVEDEGLEMNRTVLFVDDDDDIRDAVSDLLELGGWTVARAGDGEEALDWLMRNELPALILLDLKMPRCDGYEFRARQLADARLAAIPTV